MSKLVFNIRFTAKNPPSYLKGKQRAEYIANRNFYNLTAKYNYFSYILNHKKVQKFATAESYFTKSSGLFNFDGKISNEKLAEIKRELKKTNSHIWHGFMSFDSETGKCFTTAENAQKFVRQTFADFIRKAGFRLDNIELYAALHKDADHMHIHFAFFEKSPVRVDKNGVVGYTKIGKISQKVIDNYMVSANMHLSEHAKDYYTARDAAISQFKKFGNIYSRSDSFIRSKDADKLALKLAITELIEKLPARGRLQYGAEEMKEFRPAIDRVAQLIVDSDIEVAKAQKEMLRQFARVRAEVEQLAVDNKLAYSNSRRIGKSELKRLLNGKDMRNEALPLQYVDMKNVDYFDKLYEDYKTRVGNVVLKMCKDLKADGSPVIRKAYVNEQRLKVAARQRRRRAHNGLRHALYVISSICNDMENANFLKSVQQIEYEMAQENREYDIRRRGEE